MRSFPSSAVFCRDLDRAYSEVIRGEEPINTLTTLLVESLSEARP